MARCCGATGSCACRIEAGRNTTVTGIGSAGDPFVVASDMVVSVADTGQFDMGLAGAGTLESPWVITTQYASGAELTAIPDVDVAVPLDGQILAYSGTVGKWIAIYPSGGGGGGSTVTEDPSEPGTWLVT